jgi:K+-transporting ATPase KdpF subunit
MVLGRGNGFNSRARPASAGTRRFAHARCHHAAVHRHFFRAGVSLRQGLPEVEVNCVHIDLVTFIALVLSILLLGYLTISLLFPEKF